MCNLEECQYDEKILTNCYLGLIKHLRHFNHYVVPFPEKWSKPNGAWIKQDHTRISEAWYIKKNHVRNNTRFRIRSDGESLDTYVQTCAQNLLQGNLLKPQVASGSSEKGETDINNTVNNYKIFIAARSMTIWSNMCTNCDLGAMENLGHLLMECLFQRNDQNQMVH